MKHPLRRSLPVVAAVLALVLAACGSDNSSSSSPSTTGAASATTATGATAPGATAPGATAGATNTTTPAGGVTTAGMSQERCTANKAAGPITYLSSFDFSAAASILDVVVAKDRGYFNDMCLDVTIKPSFSTANYPLVASGQAQFSAAGSFTEMLNYSKDGAHFVAVADYGK